MLRLKRAAELRLPARPPQRPARGQLPAIFYLPAPDITMSELAASTHATYCPDKGDCSYHDIPAGGERSRNAVWSYATPYDAVAAIAGHFAFYPDQVDAIEVVEN